MSRLFGELRQVGIVVRDIDAAMRHWSTVCGIGPWFYTDRLAVTEFSYRGLRHDDIHLSIALANSGDVQLERTAMVVWARGIRDADGRTLHHEAGIRFI